ncbi:unnamed protein product [Trifolium pratense]|uniref:Uncharacterized protein n=1 Tax=Trifolium pratense TaxID=57577 RepID=A0ACB0LLW8_TRIPR|nr:unnamed protein product [Trifolium pratense]
MRKFLVPRAIENVNIVQSDAEPEEPPPNVANEVNEFNSNEIVRDPSLRKQIHEYAPDIQDQVRRAYILKGPTQTILKNYPQTQFGREKSKRTFCKTCVRAEHLGNEVFTKGGYKNWKSASSGLKDHVGGHGSMHNSCTKHYDDYNNQRQSIANKFLRATRVSEELYKIRLTYSLDCLRYLIAQGMAFRGHDESLTSINKGNFREMVDWVKSNNEQVRDAFDRGAKDCIMICSDIQKKDSRCKRKVKRARI